MTTTVPAVEPRAATKWFRGTSGVAQAAVCELNLTVHLGELVPVVRIR